MLIIGVILRVEPRLYVYGNMSIILIKPHY